MLVTTGMAARRWFSSPQSDLLDIVRKRPFVDGYQRTGFVTGVLFPEIDGCRPTASEHDAAQAVIALAANKIEEDGDAAFVKANLKRRRR
jgi:prophage maintenance system killer protein